jgi:hypothetical protein
VFERPSIKLLVEELSADNMPVLGISLVMRVLHQSIVFEHCLPVLLILLICRVLAGKLLDCDLMTVVVLENQVAEKSGFRVFSEFNIDISLRRPLHFGLLFG